MSPRSWTRILALGALLAACSNDPTPQDGGETDHGACVPGASVMCWCDGETPGSQVCQDDMTFAPCVCDDTASSSSTSGGSTSLGETSGDPTASTGSSDSATTSAETSESTDGTTTDATTSGDTDGTSSSGTTDARPPECTDELYSLWSACRTLASLDNPSPCGPCFEGNSCEIAKCNVECKVQGNPGLDAALTGCDIKYHQCEGVHDTPQNPYIECITSCSTSLNECNAAAAPDCDPMATNECYAAYSACIEKC